MPDPTHHHLSHALTILGARHGSLTALSRRLRLPEATVRRWATGAHLPPPSAWRGLCAALEREGLGDEVPALAGALAADIGAAYGLGPAIAGEWRPYVASETEILLASMRQTSGELCDVCGARARWPTREGGLACRLCADGGEP